MGGRGETVLYRRLYATNQQERQTMKDTITGIIDAAATNITVIALVETRAGSGGQGGGSGGAGGGSGGQGGGPGASSG